MLKTLLLLCTVLLLAQHNSQSKPLHSGFMQRPHLAGKHPGRMAAGAFRIMVKTAEDAPLTMVYAYLDYENDYRTEYGEYDDVVVRFYEDEAATIPYDVSGLTVNYRVLGYDNNSGSYDFSSSMVANGTYLTIATGIEHDYNDGESERYRDYHLSPGDYIGQSITSTLTIFSAGVNICRTPGKQ